MALTYSLKYRKLNFFQKVLLEKEGEVIIDRNSFRLKGKGAQDTGERIWFADIREMSIKDDQMSFLTYGKDRYVLSGFSNLFESFLKDFMRVRNEFMAENLFMKVGMLYHEYDCSAEIVNSFGKIINKGRSRIQFYEGSIVVIPEIRECFVIYLDFLKHHEFDEDDYILNLYLDNGNTVRVSKLGTSFEDCVQTLESLLGKMYGRIVNNLKEVLPGLDETTLLKLAYRLKGGRALPFSSLKKIHEDLPLKLMDLAFSNNPAMLEKAKILRDEGGDENFYLSFSFFTRADNHEIITKSWFICAVPAKNIVAFAMTSNPQDSAIYFFRIIMQKGDAKEKLSAKIMELDQAMVIFKGDFSPVYKDRRELRKSRYKTALKKMSFLRLLRKSLLTRNVAVGGQDFKAQLDHVYERAMTLEPVAAPILKQGAGSATVGRAIEAKTVAEIGTELKAVQNEQTVKAPTTENKAESKTNVEQDSMAKAKPRKKPSTAKQ